MKLLLLSDIHGNLSALKAVFEDIKSTECLDGIILSGDIVNYGMRPNEVISMLKSLSIPIMANVYGNHEKALLDGDTSHFSTERGKHLLEFTRKILNEESVAYIQENCNPTGHAEIKLDGKRILIIHGTLADPYWGKMTDLEMSNPEYSKYDYVIFGHSHIPNLTEKFYECDAPEYRNRHRTIFINPGSVGQPRNHNPRAQYAILDLYSESVNFNSVGYDVAAEQELYPDHLDQFYSIRLKNGI